jgi:hypothetical protein
MQCPACDGANFAWAKVCDHCGHGLEPQSDAGGIPRAGLDSLVQKLRASSSEPAKYSSMRMPTAFAAATIREIGRCRDTSAIPDLIAFYDQTCTPDGFIYSGPIETPVATAIYDALRQLCPEAIAHLASTLQATPGEPRWDTQRKVFVMYAILSGIGTAECHQMIGSLARAVPIEAEFSRPNFTPRAYQDSDHRQYMRGLHRFARVGTKEIRTTWYEEERIRRLVGALGPEEWAWEIALKWKSQSVCDLLWALPDSDLVLLQNFQDRERLVIHSLMGETYTDGTTERISNVHIRQAAGSEATRRAETRAVV